MTTERDRKGAPLDWGGWDTPFVFFTGKGGVGKTTVAAACAISLADRGRRVLLVSTDPASNLADVLGVPAGKTNPTAVVGVAGLDTFDLDPHIAADAYRERALAAYRNAVPEPDIDAFTEALAGACTVEVAAFDTFAHLLTDSAIRNRYDHVIFDTAPTGHTLRLMALPAAWADYIARTPAGASCLGPLAAVDTRRSVYEAAVAALGDPEVTTVALVTRPDRGAVAEAARASAELGALGIANQQLIVNAVLRQPLAGDEVAETYAAVQGAILDALPDPLAGMVHHDVVLTGTDLTGVPALRALASGSSSSSPAWVSEAVSPDVAGLDDLIATLAAGPARAILVTGKGGVGKTTITTQIALGLAKLGLPVHLSTTDPAGRLPELASPPPTLTMSRIDPEAETARHVATRLASQPDLDPDRRALLEEELRSPCTTELAVFIAFRGLLGRARHQHVVIDTAPSGHTLLLLDLTGEYHRQALRGFAGQPGRITTPLMRLQDPDFSRLLIVTLAETTPVAEATELQEDLRRAGIEPFGWVINASLAAAGTADPVLAGRAALELPHIHHVTDGLACQTWLVPWDPHMYAARHLSSVSAPSTTLID